MIKYDISFTLYFRVLYSYEASLFKYSFYGINKFSSYILVVTYINKICICSKLFIISLII